MTKKFGKIDIEFTNGLDRFNLGIFMDHGTLVYGSDFAKNRKGVAFDTPESMIFIAEKMKEFAEKWKEAKSTEGSAT